MIWRHNNHLSIEIHKATGFEPRFSSKSHEKYNYEFNPAGSQQAVYCPASIHPSIPDNVYMYTTPQHSYQCRRGSTKHNPTIIAPQSDQYLITSFYSFHFVWIYWMYLELYLWNALYRPIFYLFAYLLNWRMSKDWTERNWPHSF